MVSGLEILKYPDPRLRTVNKEVEQFDAHLKDLTRRMFNLMYEANGVGLAAPQVGVNEQILVYNEFGDSKKWVSECVLVNPVIVDRSEAHDIETEGCLSFPDIHGPVERSKWIKVEALNLKGRKFKKKFTGYEARIFQHEYDHLKGVVFIDHLEDADRRDVQGEIDQLVHSFGPNGSL